MRELQRSNTSSLPTVRYEMDVFRNILENKRQELKYALGEVFPENIVDKICATFHIIEAPLDTDDYIISEINKHQPLLIPLTPTTTHGTAQILLEGEEELWKARSICSIYSEDSDFLSIFPTGSHAVVLHYVNSSQMSNGLLVLRNFKFNENRSFITELNAKIQTFFHELNQDGKHPWLTPHLLQSICFRCLAMTLPNDYLTAVFFDRASLFETLSQMRIWLGTIIKKPSLLFEFSCEEQFCSCFVTTFWYNILNGRDDVRPEMGAEPSKRMRTRKQLRNNIITNCLRPLIIANESTNDDKLSISPFITRTSVSAHVSFYFILFFYKKIFLKHLFGKG